jgi:hypothetical protein
VTFLVLIATFIGLSCLIVPLLIFAAFALFDRDDPVRAVPRGSATSVTRRGG